jgi:hypothetical protein
MRSRNNPNDHPRASTAVHGVETKAGSVTQRIDDDPWVMGVLEPILLLLFIAVIAALLRLL